MAGKSAHRGGDDPGIVILGGYLVQGRQKPGKSVGKILPSKIGNDVDRIGRISTKASKVLIRSGRKILAWLSGPLCSRRTKLGWSRGKASSGLTLATAPTTTWSRPGENRSRSKILAWISEPLCSWRTKLGGSRRKASTGLTLATAPTTTWSRPEENQNHLMLEVDVGTYSQRHRHRSLMPPADKYCQGKTVYVKNLGLSPCFQSMDDYGRKIRIVARERSTGKSSQFLQGSLSRAVRVYSPVLAVQSQLCPSPMAGRKMAWDGSYIQMLREVGTEGRKTTQNLHVRKRKSSGQAGSCVKPSGDTNKSGTAVMLDKPTTFDHARTIGHKHRYGSTTPEADKYKYNRTKAVRVHNLFWAFHPQSPGASPTPRRVKGDSTDGKCSQSWQGKKLVYQVISKGVFKLLFWGGKSRHTQRKPVQVSTPIAGLPVTNG